MVKGFYLVAVVLAALAAVFAIISGFLDQSVGIGESTVKEVSRLLRDAGFELEASSAAYAGQKAIIQFATWCYVVLGILAAVCMGIATVTPKSKR